MQTLLDELQEFTTWCGMEINFKNTFLLVIDKEQKRREHIPSIDLRINCERVKTLYMNGACQYLFYWDAGNGYISTKREVVRSKDTVARDLIRSHLLTPEPWIMHWIHVYRYTFMHIIVLLRVLVTYSHNRYLLNILVCYVCDMHDKNRRTFPCRDNSRWLSCIRFPTLVPQHGCVPKLLLDNAHNHQVTNFENQSVFWMSGTQARH